MARLRVRATAKDDDDDILALCGNWRPRKIVSKANAIRDIENGTHDFYVAIGRAEVDVVVIPDRRRGKYLRTDPDRTTRNNLAELPDCEDFLNS